MARLAIAKGFLAEYAKLDKDVQGAVDVAIAEFARHAQPGLHLEKPPQSRDDRIRILPGGQPLARRRAGSRKRTGDTYCLITVLPQDKANAYAASRRFSVNQALGVLEVRDEEAIQQLRPSLQPAAKPDGRRLFADVSDADLTRLGVDAQILPMVRLLTSDADLEALQHALPEAQYAALLRAGLRHDRGRGPGGGGPARLRGARRLNRWTRTTWSPPWSARPGQVTFVSGQEELAAHPGPPVRGVAHVPAPEPARDRLPAQLRRPGPGDRRPGDRQDGDGAAPRGLPGRRASRKPASTRRCSCSPPSTATWPTPCAPSSTC